MATTLTATTWNRQPIWNEKGMTTVAGTFTYDGQTVTASEIIWLLKIPNRVTIVDGYIAGTGPNDDDIWKVGITGSESALSAAATLSATACSQVRFLTTPLKVSLTDGANPQYVTMYLTHTSGTDTATGSLSFCIKYVSNQGSGGIPDA